MKKVKQSKRALKQLFSGLTPKEKVKYLLDLGDSNDISIFAEEKGMEVYTLAKSSCKTAREKEEFEYYIALLNTIISMEGDISNIFEGLHTSSLCIENYLILLARSYYLVSGYNYIQNLNNGQKSFELESIIFLLKQDSYADLGIKTKKIGGKLEINTEEAERRIENYRAEFETAIVTAKSVEKAYYKFTKYFGLDGWMPDRLQALFDDAKADRNKGRRYSKGIIREINKNSDWGKEGNFFLIDSDYLLKSQYTEGLDPLYIEYINSGIFRSVVGETAKESRYVEKHLSRYGG